MGDIDLSTKTIAQLTFKAVAKETQEAVNKLPHYPSEQESFDMEKYFENRRRTR